MKKNRKSKKEPIEAANQSKDGAAMFLNVSYTPPHSHTPTRNPFKHVVVQCSPIESIRFAIEKTKKQTDKQKQTEDKLQQHLKVGRANPITSPQEKKQKRKKRRTTRKKKRLEKTRQIINNNGIKETLSMLLSKKKRFIASRNPHPPPSLSPLYSPTTVHHQPQHLPRSLIRASERT